MLINLLPILLDMDTGFDSVEGMGEACSSGAGCKSCGGGINKSNQCRVRGRPIKVIYKLIHLPVPIVVLSISIHLAVGIDPWLPWVRSAVAVQILGVVKVRSMPFDITRDLNLLYP